MKALIRNPGETVTEKDDIEGIDWQTGSPLTNAAWCGGSYTLVQNYVPQEDAHESYEEVLVKPDPVVEENNDDYVVIDGKRYSKEELRKLIE